MDQDFDQDMKMDVPNDNMQGNELINNLNKVNCESPSQIEKVPQPIGSNMSSSPRKFLHPPRTQMDAHTFDNL